MIRLTPGLLVRYNVHMSIKNTLPISEARKKIFDIAKQVQKPGQYFTLTEKGHPTVVVMSAEEFESIMETMEIMGDPKLMSNIKKAEEEYKKGEYVTWEDLKNKWGIHDQKKEIVLVREKAKKKYRTARK